MATTTTYYSMSKPTLLEAADIRVINGDIDTIDRVMHSHTVSMAPVFDPSSTYAVGDLVMYNDILYKCKTAITTAAAWDSTKWDATNIVDEFPEGGGGGGGIDYSTTEQNTGLKWIDGKDIYQKSFSLTSPSDGTSTDIIDISSLNVDRLPFIYASIKTQHNETYANGGSFLIWSRFDPNSTDTIACQVTNSDYYSSDMIVTIQYTKTSS